MKKSDASTVDSSVPEIPRNARSRVPRHRPSQVNAKIPRRKTTINLDINTFAWLEAEQERLGTDRNNLLNDILREYIVRRVGDRAVLDTAQLTSKQRDEVKKIVEESLSRKGLIEKTYA